MYKPDLCKNCKEHCCTRPCLTTDEYLRLYNYVGNDKIQSHGPVWINDAWMFERGCPGLTDKGCIMAYEDKPLMCRLFPWIAVPILNDLHKDAHNDLLLTMRCPQWRAFGENYESAMKEFENG